MDRREPDVLVLVDAAFSLERVLPQALAAGTIEG